jgi:hypothetical protein
MGEFRMTSKLSIRARKILVFGAVAAIAATPIVAETTSATAANTSSTTDYSTFHVTEKWSHRLDDPKKTFYFGSPGVGTLDSKGPAVIVGNQLGKIYALHVSDGSAVKGWPYVGHTSIQSTPAVSGSGATAKVFVGTGVSTAKTRGGYLAIRSTGVKSWFRQPYLLPGSRGGTRGVMSSLAVGPIQSSADVVGGAMGQMQWAINATTSHNIKGFAWLQADTNFSSPALADLNGDGHTEIIEGGDSTRGVAGTYHYGNGGHIRILGPMGNTNKKYANEGLRCQYNTTQVVQSSPAVGGFLAGGKIGIVVGTGSFYKNTSDSHRLIAIDTNCKKIWSVVMKGNTHPSPAIADVDGSGTLDVVTTSEKNDVRALRGSDGKGMWTKQLPDTTVGSVVTFQAPGAKFQYVVVPSIHGIYILDGRNGNVVAHVGQDLRLMNSPAITRDPSGKIGITIAGQGSHSRSGIEHFTVDGSNVASVNTYGAWPQFHHDSRLTGFAPYHAQS